MTMRRWEPLREMSQLQRHMDRLMEDFFHPSRMWPSWWGDESRYFPIDMYQTPDHVVVEAEIPGVNPEEVEVNLTGQTLDIKWQTDAERESKEENYFFKERRSGAVARTISLPSGLNTDKAEASFENGVLTITIPKSEEVKPKALKVKAKKVPEAKKAA